MNLSKLGEAFERFCERLDRFVGIALFHAFTYAMADVLIEHQEGKLVEPAVNGIQLRQNILAANTVLNHLFDTVHLTDQLV